MKQILLVLSMMFGVAYGAADLKYVDIYGSADGVVWEQVSHNEYTRATLFPVSGYAYIRVRAYNNLRTITVTKRL